MKQVKAQYAIIKKMVNSPVRNIKYGWIPDLPDQRDYPYIRLAVKILPVPPKIDLRSYCSPVENQGSLGSCTACALVGNLELLKLRKLKKRLNFSKLFLYYNERAVRRAVKSDSGASIRDGIKSLVNLGDCLEKLWPYAEKKFKVKPDLQAYKDALEYQIKSYYRINTIAEMKHTLAGGFPFVFGFAVYESFESPKVEESGIVPLPHIGERVVGGHAVLAVGYDDSRQYFIVRNSWGKSWGKEGYFFMPYKYLTSRSLSADFWTIRDME